MDTTELNAMLTAAIPIAGSQRKLAQMLDMEPANLIKMKKGERPANWRVRGKLRTILGDAPARAFMLAMAEELGQSENKAEREAAAVFATFSAMLDAKSSTLTLGRGAGVRGREQLVYMVSPA